MKHNKYPSRNSRFWFKTRPQDFFDHPEMITGSLTGVVRLRRGSKISENTVLGRKMLFLDGH